MENRIKELIAIGASITANCQPCLSYHINKANKYGVNEDEIKEAISVGKMVRTGASGKMDEFVSSLIADIPLKETASQEGNGCGEI